MPKISKRRQAVIDSYGFKPKGRPRKPKSVDLHAHLPKNSPIRIQRELEQMGITLAEKSTDEEIARAKQTYLNNQAIKNKPRLNLTDADRAERRAAYTGRKRHHNKIHLDGLLSASSAKKGTVDKPTISGESSAPFYNYKDNFIEEQHHGKASAYDPRFIDLIEIQESGKMIWHGETCAICTMPPSTIGEVMLAQYGEADFVCTDCGRLVHIKTPTNKWGWVFAPIDKFKRNTIKQLQRYHIPIDEEEYA
jgi:hypothetical protein|tara:strand:+ start:1828 stop:2577 length:750 start_codon:yes stop_codon:yes gene_type:complete